MILMCTAIYCYYRKENNIMQDIVRAFIEKMPTYRCGHINEITPVIATLSRRCFGRSRVLHTLPSK